MSFFTVARFYRDGTASKRVMFVKDDFSRIRNNLQYFTNQVGSQILGVYVETQESVFY